MNLPFFDFIYSHVQTYRKALSGQVHIPDHFTVIVANLIKKLLHIDQSKRLGRTVGGTTAIMCHRWFANFDWVSFCQITSNFTLLFHSHAHSFCHNNMAAFCPNRMHYWITEWKRLLCQSIKILTTTAVRTWGEKKLKDLPLTFCKCHNHINWARTGLLLISSLASCFKAV